MKTKKIFNLFFIVTISCISLFFSVNSWAVTPQQWRELIKRIEQGIPKVEGERQEIREFYSRINVNSNEIEFNGLQRMFNERLNDPNITEKDAFNLLIVAPIDFIANRNVFEIIKALIQTWVRPHGLSVDNIRLPDNILNDVAISGLSSSSSLLFSSAAPPLTSDKLDLFPGANNLPVALLFEHYFKRSSKMSSLRYELAKQYLKQLGRPLSEIEQRTIGDINTVGIVGLIEIIRQELTGQTSRAKSLLGVEYRRRRLLQICLPEEQRGLQHILEEMAPLGMVILPEFKIADREKQILQNLIQITESGHQCEKRIASKQCVYYKRWSFLTIVSAELSKTEIEQRIKYLTIIKGCYEEWIYEWLRFLTPKSTDENDLEFVPSLLHEFLALVPIAEAMRGQVLLDKNIIPYIIQLQSNAQRHGFEQIYLSQLQELQANLTGYSKKMLGLVRVANLAVQKKILSHSSQIQLLLERLQQLQQLQQKQAIQTYIEEIQKVIKETQGCIKEIKQLSSIEVLNEQHFQIMNQLIRKQTFILNLPQYVKCCQQFLLKQEEELSKRQLDIKNNLAKYKIFGMPEKDSYYKEDILALNKIDKYFEQSRSLQLTQQSISVPLSLGRFPVLQQQLFQQPQPQLSQKTNDNQQQQHDEQKLQCESESELHHRYPQYQDLHSSQPVTQQNVTQNALQTQPSPSSSPPPPPPPTPPAWPPLTSQLSSSLMLSPLPSSMPSLPLALMPPTQPQSLTGEQAASSMSKKRKITEGSETSEAPKAGKERDKVKEQPFKKSRVTVTGANQTASQSKSQNEQTKALSLGSSRVLSSLSASASKPTEGTLQPSMAFFQPMPMMSPYFPTFRPSAPTPMMPPAMLPYFPVSPVATPMMPPAMLPYFPVSPAAMPMMSPAMLPDFPVSPAVMPWMPPAMLPDFLMPLAAMQWMQGQQVIGRLPQSSLVPPIVVNQQAVQQSGVRQQRVQSVASSSSSASNAAGQNSNGQSASESSGNSSSLASSRANSGSESDSKKPAQDGGKPSESESVNNNKKELSSNRETNKQFDSVTNVLSSNGNSASFGLSYLDNYTSYSERVNMVINAMLNGELTDLSEINKLKEEINNSQLSSREKKELINRLKVVEGIYLEVARSNPPNPKYLIEQDNSVERQNSNEYMEKIIKRNKPQIELDFGSNDILSDNFHKVKTDKSNIGTHLLKPMKSVFGFIENQSF